jgi:hypothetical protein
LSRSRHRQRVSLNSRENLDIFKKCVSTIEKSRSRLNINVQTKKSRSIEIEKFVEIVKFLHFSTVCLDLDRELRGFLHFLVEISQSVKTFHNFHTQKGLNNVEISQQISMRLDKF